MNEERLFPVDPTKGCVYFGQRRDMPNLIKIGHTTRPPSIRAREWGGLKLLLVLPGEDERAFHRRFAHLRVAGTEWFNDAYELADFLDEMTGRRCADGPDDLILDPIRWPSRLAAWWIMRPMPRLDRAVGRMSAGIVRALEERGFWDERG